MTRSKLPEFSLAILFSSSAAYADELIVPNNFQSGTPALASEVNENFAAAALSINDNVVDIAANTSAIADLQAAITALTPRVDALEGISLDVTTQYATDLIFLTDTGSLIIPVATGQQTPSEVVATGFEYAGIPGLTDVEFAVEEDNTLVYFQAVGQAYVGGFNTAAVVYVALEIDGSIPSLGAEQQLLLVADDNLSGTGSQNWNISYPVMMNAGTHTFSVKVKTTSQAQDDIAIDGRTLEGHTGRVKTILTKLRVPQ